MDLPAVFCCFVLFSLYYFSFRCQPRRRAAVRLLMLFAAGTVWGGTVTPGFAEFILYRWPEYDQWGDAVMLTGEETELAEGWYAAKGELTYDTPLTLTGDVTLILMDGAVLTMAGEEAWGIGNDSGPFYDLTVYGQENQTGVLKAGGNHDKDLIRAGEITVRGGKILSENGTNAVIAASGIEIAGGSISGAPIQTTGGGIEILGGEIRTGEISAAGGITITGGEVTVEADEAGSTGSITGETITLGWKEYSETDSFIQADAYVLTGETNTVTFAEEQQFTDDPDTGENIFSGETDPGALAGRKLVPIYAVTIGDVLGSGTILTDKEYAVYGEDVTMTFIPSDGDDFISLRAGDYWREWFEGSEDVTKNPDGSYTYVKPMSRYNMIVTAKFGVPVDYVHWDGTTWSHLAVKLTGNETGLDDGYYFADKDIEYNFTDGDHLKLDGARIYFILADGVTITMRRDVESVYEDPMIESNGRIITYGQAAQTGRLRLAGRGVLIKTHRLVIHGGNVEFEDHQGMIVCNAETWMTRGNLTVGELKMELGSIYIDGGEVSAEVLNGNIGIEGGKITAGTIRAIPYFPPIIGPDARGRIILGWRSGEDFIQADEFVTNGTVQVFEEEYITDEEGTIYSGELSSDQIAAISGKKLTAANILVGNEAENGAVEAGSTFSDTENTVTLTVYPAEGYALKSLTVKHGETEIPWEEGDGENTYTFVMPEDVVPEGLEAPQQKSPAEEKLQMKAEGSEGEHVELIPADPVLVNAEFGIPSGITVDPEISNGTVEVSPAEAFEGDEVTLTAVPAEGYVLSHFIVTVTDTSETIEVRNGKFIMPAGSVTVSAVFEAQQTVPARRSGLTGFFSLEEMPKTGLSVKPGEDIAAEIAYARSGLTLGLPSLSVMADLLQVPLGNDGYEIEKLGDFAGLLEGSSVPGEGLSIITAHNHLDAETAGPFALLSKMQNGDRIFVTDGNENMRAFSVYSNVKLAADDLKTVAEIAAQSENTLVLITCEDESIGGGYINRRVVFAAPL